MSGGHFSYKEYGIQIIIEDIEEIIERNHSKDRYGFSYDFPVTVIKQFENAIKALRKAYIYTKRIDYLLSGDDGTESFLRRLKEELKELRWL